MVVTDGALSADDDGGARSEVGEAASTEVVAAAAASDVDDTPVDRLTCRFSTLASAASSCRAGTAEAEIRAKRTTFGSDHGCILKIVFGRTDLVCI